MKTDLLICEGFASGVTDGVLNKDYKTISYWVLPIVKRHLHLDKYSEVHSTSIWARLLIRLFIKKNANKNKNLLLVGKSMGVVKLYRVIEDHYHLFEKYNKISFLSVDGHSRLFKDIFKGRKPYGEKRPFRYKHNWSRKKIAVFSLFQWFKFPKGAAWSNVPREDCKRVMNPTDHFKIIRDPEMFEQLDKALRFLV